MEKLHLLLADEDLELPKKETLFRRVIGLWVKQHVAMQLGESTGPAMQCHCAWYRFYKKQFHYKTKEFFELAVSSICFVEDWCMQATTTTNYTVPVVEDDVILPVVSSSH